MLVSTRQRYDDGNVFARILRGELPAEIIYEDDHALALQDVNPLAPVHGLVIPRKKYVSFADFVATARPEEVAGLFCAVGHVADILGITGSGYRILTNVGTDGMQHVPHLHVHVFGGCPLGPMIEGARPGSPLLRAKGKPSTTPNSRSSTASR